MDHARQTQKKLIPENFDNDHFISGFNFPARYLSGDFYDFIKTGADEYLFCLGDVSGKGINASLLMVKCSSLFRGLAKSATCVVELMNIINQEICDAKIHGMFITLVIGLFNAREQTIEVCNAGHLPTLVINDEGMQEHFATNIPVGIDRNEYFDTDFIDCKNSRVVLYSDGLVDRRDENGKPYGFERIKKMLVEANRYSADRFLEDLSQELVLENAELEDDATVLMINTRGKQNAARDVA